MGNEILLEAEFLTLSGAKTCTLDFEGTGESVTVFDFEFLTGCRLMCSARSLSHYIGEPLKSAPQGGVLYAEAVESLIAVGYADLVRHKSEPHYRVYISN